MSLPPRPSVVMFADSSMPWKPAAMTISPASSALRTRSVEMERMRALVWMLSVTMPIWAPVRLIALWPSAWMAIAINATLTCSPVASSMSISRAGGSRVISRAISTNRSVCRPIALTTTTTWWPCCRAAMAFCAAARIFPLSARLVPPNFWTTIDMRRQW